MAKEISLFAPSPSPRIHALADINGSDPSKIQTEASCAICSETSVASSSAVCVRP
jgi:hypothetical protein